MEDNGRIIDDIECYAVAAEGEFLKRFKLILRSGERYSLPYSILPIVILTEEQDLQIKSHGIYITLKGRNLAAIEEYLFSESLLWVKEANTKLDSGEAYVFVSEILLAGKAISKFDIKTINQEES